LGLDVLELVTVAKRLQYELLVSDMEAKLIQKLEINVAQIATDSIREAIRTLSEVEYAMGGIHVKTRDGFLAAEELVGQRQREAELAEENKNLIMALRKMRCEKEEIEQCLLMKKQSRQ
jgi:hypothetical protein